MALFSKTSPEAAYSSPLTLDQAQRLLRATEKRKPLHAMLMLALYGGVGKDEVLLLKKADVDFTKNVITFPKPKRGLLFLPDTMTAISEAVQAQTFKTEYVFPFTDRVVKQTLNDLGNSVLGFAISWSTLRKTWAVLCGQHEAKMESMIFYSQSGPEALARWMHYGKEGTELPIDLLSS